MQSLNAFNEGCAVIKFRHYDKLGVHFNAVFTKSSHNVDEVSGVGIFDKFHSLVVVERVDGYVERAQFQTKNTLDFCLADVGHSHVATADETETIVVVLDIQGVTKPFGKLVNKAKYALVFATYDFHLFKLYSKGLTFLFVDLYFFQFAVAIYHYVKLFLVVKIEDVKNILTRISSYLHHFVTDVEPQLFCKGGYIQNLWHFSILCS